MNTISIEKPGSVRVARYVLAAALSLLTACATQIPLLDAPWPDDPEMPGRAWFEARYAADTVNQQHQRPAEYLRWVVRFYYGWIAYPDGWVDITRRALELTGGSADGELARRMMLLGRRVAAEWAKESPERVIRNSTIAAWGEALSIAAERNGIEPIINRIAGDVDALFAGGLQHREITLARYFPDYEEPNPFER